MILPKLLVLTDRRMSEAAGLGLVATLTQAIQCGARAVILREKDLPVGDRVELALQISVLLAPCGGTLIVASDREVAEKAGTPWLHLSASDDVPRDRQFRWGRSCHDAASVTAAAAEGASYVTVSPVYVTQSKPGYGPALGIEGLSGLVHAARGLPVYALGGITADRVESCHVAGAAGVAVMGEVMRSPTPGRVVEELTR